MGDGPMRENLDSEFSWLMRTAVSRASRSSNEISRPSGRSFLGSRWLPPFY